MTHAADCVLLKQIDKLACNPRVCHCSEYCIYEGYSCRTGRQHPGHNDAAIYVGNDDNVVVRNNTVTQSMIGVEIENSTNCTVNDNVLTGNTGGMLIVVLPNLPIPKTESVEIHDNAIIENNFTSGEPTLLPTGTGILALGSDDVRIHDNMVLGNDTVGLALFANPSALADPRIDPFVDNNTVHDNKIHDNGHNPDPVQPFFPAADIVFIADVVDMSNGEVLIQDPDPIDNCFKNNDFDTDFPPGIVGSFNCKNLSSKKRKAIP